GLARSPGQERRPGGGAVAAGETSYSLRPANSLMSAPLPVDEDSGPFSDSSRAPPGRPGRCGPDEGEACMNAKVVCSWALVLAVVGVGPARAEDLPAPTRYGDAPQAAPPEASPPAPPASLSTW